ncbi:MAG TPA: porin [Gemmatales bacterium]|nr:porin [Gemmatales bacterium]
MVHAVKWHGLVSLGILLLAMGASAEPPPPAVPPLPIEMPPATPLPPPRPQAGPPSGLGSEATGTPGTIEEILERLRRAEQQIAALETERLLRTQPESEPAATQGPIESLWHHWRSGGDPGIITAAQLMGPTAVAHDRAAKGEPPKADKPKKWYEKLSIRGYSQYRYNATLLEAPGSFPAQYVGDSSVGEHQDFIIRRARLILSGDVSDHMFIYLQPDFAANVPGSPDANQYTQIRDWYADCYVDKEKVWRFRVGQSKVPYGWENLQSSSNRLPLDRHDALNSAVRNERDLGVFFYWTPIEAQQFFKDVLENGLKGSGNYGVFGFGLYNGQGGSFRELNDNVHAVSRLTVPLILDNGQRLELGVQGYTGRYTVLSTPISPLGVGPAVRPANTLETFGRAGVRDQRIAGSFIWYPQPVGFQVEWTTGQGPSLNEEQTAIVERSLSGGYVLLCCRLETGFCGIFYPFARYHRFRGGYKPERNAPFSQIDELEVGTEWQITPQMEFTWMWTLTDRTSTAARSEANTPSYGQFQGQLLRLQFQVNY